MKHIRMKSIIAILLLCCWAMPSLAARLETGASLTIGPEEVQPQDLYFGGTALRIEGKVEGSVIAGAQSVAIPGTVSRNLFVGAQTVEVSGPVGGDILAGCATLHVKGPVSGAVRAGAGSITLNDAVGRDVLVGCRDLTIGKESEVSGDVIAGCGILNIAGIVRGNLKVAAGDIVISGIIDGDVIATVEDRLHLTEDARVFGRLLYRAEKELDIGNPDAFGDIQFDKITRPGDIRKLEDWKPKPSLFLSFLLPFAILSVLGALVVGFILLAIWRHTLSHALENVRLRFGRAIGLGTLTLFAAPAAVFVSFLLIITIPAGLVGFLLFLVSLYLSKILAGMFLGKWLFGLFGGHTASPWLTAPVGIILVYALCAVPFVGWMVWLFALMIGFGFILELLALSRRP